MFWNRPAKILMEDLTVEDIEFRMKEYLDMNVPPFEVKQLKVQ
jgi:hypothetical protein